jgi:hypothetical protein
VRPRRVLLGWALGAAAVVTFAAWLAIAPGCSRRAGRGQIQAWNAEIERLQAEQDSLRARAAELVARDPRIQNLPEGDVVVSVPTVFVRGVIERVFADVVDNVTLSLSGIKAHVEKTIKKVITIGDLVLDVEIHEVIGKLQPGRPDVRFGGDRVSLALPVALKEGHGKATIHFVWDGKNVADATCGDMDITETVAGSVIPDSYSVSGSMSLAIRDNRIVCTPTFPETKVRIHMKPSEASWAAVNDILASKHGVCGWVLDKVDVPGLLEGIVQEKGINIKLPINKIKPFVLPSGVRDTVTVGTRVLAFETRTKTVRIDPDAIWYSADVEVKVR